MRTHLLLTAVLAAMTGALLACEVADDRSSTVDAAGESEAVVVEPAVMVAPAPVAEPVVAPTPAHRGHWIELGAPDAAGDEHIRGGLAVAIDPAGGVTAVWRQGQLRSADRAGVIWANHYRPGLGWGTATQIQPDASYGNTAPMVVADGLGRATVIWAASVDGTGLARDLWANRYVPGAGWTGPTRIETDPGDVVGALPQVDTAGRVTVFWRQRDGGALRVRSNRYDPATGWGSAADVVGTGPTLLADTVDVRTPVMAVEPRGRVAVVWSRGRHVGVRVFAP